MTSVSLLSDLSEVIPSTLIPVVTADRSKMMARIFVSTRMLLRIDMIPVSFGIGLAMFQERRQACSRLSRGFVFVARDVDIFLVLHG